MLEDYTYWLEYKILSMEMAKVLDSVSNIEDKNKLVHVIHNRKNNVLRRIHNSFHKNIDLIKKAENKILQFRSGVSLPKSEDGSKLETEDWNDREVQCFTIQMELLLSTLNKLAKSETGNDDDLEKLIEEIKEYINRDFSARAEEGSRQSKKDQENAPHVYPYTAFMLSGQYWQLNYGQRAELIILPKSN